MGSDAQVGRMPWYRRVRIASCENGNGIAIAIQNVNLTVGGRVVVLIVGTKSVEGLMGAEGEGRMDLDVVSLAAGSGGEDSGDTITIIGTNTNTNTSNTSSNSNHPNPNLIHMHHSSSISSRNSNRLHPFLRQRHLKLFNLFGHLPHRPQPMSVKVNILAHQSSNHTCHMGLMLIRHPFRFRILLLMQAWQVLLFRYTQCQGPSRILHIPPTLHDSFSSVSWSTI